MSAFSSPVSKAFYLFMLCYIICLGCGKEPSNLDEVTTFAPAACNPIYGLDSLLNPGQIILLGEMHGTQEAPAYVAQICCLALKKNLTVSVGLELPQSDQAIFDAYFQSKGSANDRQKILELSFWSRDYQDGRASQAMFGLVESIRQLKSANKAIEVVLIDEPGSGDRDQTMAQNIIDKANQQPEHFMIVLAGNYHTIIEEYGNQMGAIVLRELGKERVLSLKQSFRGGSAWVDTGGREPGPVRMGGDGRKGVGVVLQDYMVEYHGTFEMDSIHHSRPAKEMLHAN